MDALADDPVPDLLVDLDADGPLRDVPDPTRPPVVELVGHALVDGAVDLDVDVLAGPVGFEVGGERDVTFLPEAAGKEVPGAGSESVTGRYCCFTTLFSLFSLKP